MYKIGFDNDKYLSLQSEKIKERIAKFGGKLYLEFGGKLFDDYHASRVLPGFHPDSKINMLAQLKDEAEIVIVINAADIEKNKVRSDLGITYDLDVLRLIDAFRGYGLYVGSVCLTRFAGQPSAIAYQKKLESLGMKVYRHYSIPGYPSNIPLKHPVNLAYEAATADLNDVNMIDPFHLEAYGETTINYNRDVEIFPVVSAMFEKIMGSCPYKSPTDMGVNMAGFGIVDDEAVRDAAKQEIIRRYYHTLCQKRQGTAGDDQILKLELLMKQAGVTIDDRAVVSAANIKAETTGEPAAAIQLPDGRVLTGRTSTLLGASSALLLNALKALAGIPDEVQLISPTAIGPIQDLKTNYLGNRNPRLHTDETLIALSICAATDDTAKAAVEQLKNLKGSEVHSSVILSQIDMNTFRKLGVNLTCEPHYQNQKLYHN